MKKGFTLIELMVSVAIFTIVATISLGALLAMAQADTKSENISSVVNNLNAALESMTRNIRTGYDYHCGSFSGGDCLSGDSYFKFTGPSGVDIIYKFDNSSACNQTTAVKGCILRSVNGGTFLPITPPEVIIVEPVTSVAGLKFFLRGSAPYIPTSIGGSSDMIQPNVIISVIGYIDLPNEQRSEFRIQTSATQRLYDH
jgi:prepilin-type N-terminal cleavage/methylation domain-containing protein